MKIVSVIVIAYNEEKNISDCINSILKQSYPKFEFVIVNDGSTDQTEDIIKRFKDKRIIYTKHSQNKGYSSARNTGLKLAKGDYVFFIDADSVAQNDWIENGLKFMEKNLDLVVASGDCYMPSFFRKEKSIRDVVNYWESSVGEVYDVLAMTNCVFRHKILNELGRFDELYNLGGEDAELSLRILKEGKKMGRCEKMRVFHKPKKMSFKIGLSHIKRRCFHVYLIKYYNKDFPKLRRSGVCYGFILSPHYFFPLLFPPLIFLAIKPKKIRYFKDIIFLIPLYFGLCYLRFMFWKTAFKERIFLI